MWLPERLEGWLVEVLMISVMVGGVGLVIGAFAGLGAQAGLHAIGVIKHSSFTSRRTDLWLFGGALLGAGIAFGVTYHSTWQERQQHLRERDEFWAQVGGDQ